MQKTLNKQSTELKEKILHMMIEQDTATISEARDALSFALIEYDSMCREMAGKLLAQGLAAVFNKRVAGKE